MNYKKLVLAIIFLANGTVWSINAPIGLANCGNTCYMNSVFQVFFSAQDLIDSISTAQAPVASKKCTAKSLQLSQIFQDTAKLYFEAIQKNQRSLSRADMRPLSQALEQRMRWGSYSQQDAHEAFGAFLDGLCDCYPAIEELFNCGAVSIIDRCEKLPQFKKSKIDVATTVELAAGDENNLNYSSLEEALDAYIKPEKLSDYKPDEKNQMACNKTIILERSSRYILIMLKIYRFYFDGSHPIKMFHNVRIPQFLDMSKFILNNQPARYRLTGAALHNGHTANSGHYTACVRRDNDWFYCDDSTITSLGELSQEGALEDILKRIGIYTYQEQYKPASAVFTPYVLLYEKIGQAEQQDQASTKDVTEFTHALQQLERALA